MDRGKRGHLEWNVRVRQARVHPEQASPGFVHASSSKGLGTTFLAPWLLVGGQPAFIDGAVDVQGLDCVQQVPLDGQLEDRGNTGQHLATRAWPRAVHYRTHSLTINCGTGP